MRMYPELTGMRAYAAGYVVLAHVLTIYPQSGRPSPGHLPIIHLGWIGVDFFFVLSAFLLSLPLLKDPAKAAQGSFWRSYLWRRWLRIGPPYYAAILLALLLANDIAYLWREPVDILLHVFYVHTFVPTSFTSINPLFWTLGIEFQFYLLLPLLVWILTRRGWAFSLAAILVTTLAWRAGTFGGPDGRSWLSFTLPGFLWHFGLGVVLARAFVEKWHLAVQPRFLGPLAILLGLVLPLYILVPVGTYAQGDTDLVANVFLRPFLAVGFGVLILACMRGPSLLQRLFASRASVFVGLFSYSLYLVHYPVMAALDRWDALVDRGIWAWAVVAVPCAILASYLFYRLVERPSLHARGRLVRASALDPPASAGQARV